MTLCRVRTCPDCNGTITHQRPLARRYGPRVASGFRKRLAEPPPPATFERWHARMVPWATEDDFTCDHQRLEADDPAFAPWIDWTCYEIFEIWRSLGSP